MFLIVLASDATSLLNIPLWGKWNAKPVTHGKSWAATVSYVSRDVSDGLTWSRHETHPVCLGCYVSVELSRARAATIRDTCVELGNHERLTWCRRIAHVWNRWMGVWTVSTEIESSTLWKWFEWPNSSTQSCYIVVKSGKMIQSLPASLDPVALRLLTYWPIFSEDKAIHVTLWCPGNLWQS